MISRESSETDDVSVDLQYKLEQVVELPQHFGLDILRPARPDDSF